MASGMSAFSVSRTGLPLSQLSATRDLLEVLLDPVGDLVEDDRALGGGGLAPGGGGRVRGVEGELDVLGGGAGDLAEHLAVDRRDVLEVLALDRRDTLAADPVVVARLE